MPPMLFVFAKTIQKSYVVQKQIEKTGTTLGKNEDKYILSVVKMAGKPKSRWKYCKNSQFEKNLINMQKNR